MMVKAPRLLICAPASGGGKTTFTCGLLHTLIRRGMVASACKCGPDYIDPMFHSEVIGAKSRNLDLFFSKPEQVRALVADSALASDITIIEGVMGYYDGIAVSDTASAWDVARVTQSPAVLVVDGRGRARSIAAEVQGFARFRDDSRIAGVVLNRVSAMACSRIKQLVEDETGIRVYGCLPVLDDCSLESRHLGLVTASEVEDLRGKLNRLADAMEQTIDIDGLVELAKSAGDIELDGSVNPVPEAGAPNPSSEAVKNVRIAVAHDDAFCFYYADALRLLEELGAQLVEFSPIADSALPSGISGIYIGGGYPELHAQELSSNVSMRESLAGAISNGMPTVAECGGFMYLHQQMEDPNGITYPQVGIVEGTSFRTPRLGRFGYVTLTAQQDGLLAETGDTLQAHEFHYWDSTNAGQAFLAEKPQSTRNWQCGMHTATMYAGYPHLYLPGNPQAAQRFVEACIDYARRCQGSGQSSVSNEVDA
ncbi:MAG: cobyrinate a,c-diamide synthase [Eggerthellaceae bacterium]|nr:cobyrinate a,c-diamide synthase [Eggerthellaceae bacterium]